jgi:hypothetical protein
MMYAEVESALLGIRNVSQRAQHIAWEENHQIKLVAISALALGLRPMALWRLPGFDLAVFSQRIPGPRSPSLVATLPDPGAPLAPIRF